MQKSTPGKTRSLGLAPSLLVVFLSACAVDGGKSTVAMSPTAPSAGDSVTTHPLGENRGRRPAVYADGADLPNGWRITPAGRTIGSTGDLVTNLTLSPDGKVLVSVNSGFLPHGLEVFDATTGQHLQRIELTSAFLGLAWGAGGHTLYAAGGNASGSKSKGDPVAPIYAFAYAGGRLTEKPTARFVETHDPKQVWWTGVAYHPDKRRLYALNRGTGREPGSVVVFDAKSTEILVRIQVQVSPYQVALASDGKRLFVSNWSSDSVSVIDTADHKVIATIEVGDNPNDLRLADDGRLFVACANDNTVQVIDTKTLTVIEKLSTTLTPRAPGGSTPNALAIDEKRHLLYIANADNNSVAVAHIENRVHTNMGGFIPTGWYPSALALGPNGGTLYVGNAKGNSGHPDLLGPHSPLLKSPEAMEQAAGSTTSANTGLFGTGEGNVKTLQNSTVEQVPVSDLKTRLPLWTRQVVENTPYKDSLLTEAPPAFAPSVIPHTVGAASPIRHIIYVIKENRTYDQVFGDLLGANGDPRLTIFGEKVTPNQHALAKEYVILDNLYCDGEVSNDGHRWLASAYATDFYEKQWPALYGSRSAAGYEVEAVVPAGGFIWDLAKRKGLTYRTYAEGTYDAIVDGKPVLLPRMGMEALMGHIAPGFPNGLNLPDTEKFKIWLAEFREYEKNYNNPDPEKRLPNFQTVWMMGDHTEGTKVSKRTPIAMVADNDYAIGQMVEAVSKSRYWPETAIFIIEDDAQDGSDHVDARRTVGLVLSPYVKRGMVDSTLYSTCSMLRSMELLLGLPPMSQYDAAAIPMYAAFGTEAKAIPFTAIPPMVDTKAINQKTAWGTKASGRMDFSEPDRAPMLALNEIIWKSVHGVGSVMPAPVHRFRPLIEMNDDEDLRR